MQIAEQILDVFQDFRMTPTPIDEYEQKGKGVLRQKIEGFVAAGKPVDFVMLGFPMKSPNSRDKVLGQTPDLAEEVSLANLTTFNNRVKAVYPAGVNVSVVSDGYVFSDVMDVSDATVQLYNDLSYDMVKGGPVSWFDLRDFYQKGTSISSLREKVVSQWGISPEELERRILMDADVNHLYRGMIKFMTLDIATRDFPSKNALQNTAKKLAREMMFRNEAYSKLVQTEFSSHIRLSIHPSVNNGTKFSFQLIPSPKAWTSPWHCALLVDRDGQYATIHRKDAEAEGFELVYKDGKPYYFQAN